MVYNEKSDTLHTDSNDAQLERGSSAESWRLQWETVEETQTYIQEKCGDSQQDQIHTTEGMDITVVEAPRSKQREPIKEFKDKVEEAPKPAAEVERLEKIEQEVMTLEESTKVKRKTMREIRKMRQEHITVEEDTRNHHKRRDSQSRRSRRKQMRNWSNRQKRKPGQMMRHRTKSGLDADCVRLTTKTDSGEREDHSGRTGLRSRKGNVEIRIHSILPAGNDISRTDA